MGVCAFRAVVGSGAAGAGVEDGALAGAAMLHAVAVEGVLLDVVVAGVLGAVDRACGGDGSALVVPGMGMTCSSLHNSQFNMT